MFWGRRVLTVVKRPLIQRGLLIQSHFRCGGSLGSVKCSMCGIQDETLQHFVNECPVYSDIKERAGFVGVVDVQSVICLNICSPNRESSRRCVKMLFEMWLERIRVWRHAHPYDKRIQPLF